jgi:hypothetical protein
MQRLADRATVIVPVYYRCPGICTPVLQELASVVNKTPELKPGEDYRILTVSFEPEEDAEPEITTIDPRTAEADGRAYIDDVNDALRIDLPEEEDYDTIGGFVFATLGHIPEIDESFDHENVRVTVLEAEKTKVTRVRIEVLNRPTDQLKQASEQAE